MRAGHKTTRSVANTARVHVEPQQINQNHIEVIHYTASPPSDLNQQVTNTNSLWMFNSLKIKVIHARSS